MTELEFFFFLLTIFLCFTVQGITGFGASVLALPFLYLFMDIKDAVYIVSMVSFLMSIFMTIFHFKHIQWKHLIIMVAVVFPGLPIGMIISKNSGGNFLNYLLGGVMFGVGVYNLIKTYILKTESKDSTFKQVTGISSLFFGGIIHGALASGGALIVIYAKDNLKDKRHCQATLSMMWLIVNSIFILINYLEHNFTQSLINLSLTTIPVILASILIGNIIAKKINVKYFLTIIYLVLVFGSFFLIF